jgi:hypothetical protein
MVESSRIVTSSVVNLSFIGLLSLEVGRVELYLIQYKKARKGTHFFEIIKLFSAEALFFCFSEQF